MLAINIIETYASSYFTNFSSSHSTHSVVHRLLNCPSSNSSSIIRFISRVCMIVKRHEIQRCLSKYFQLKVIYVAKVEKFQTCTGEGGILLMEYERNYIHIVLLHSSDSTHTFLEKIKNIIKQ